MALSAPVITSAVVAVGQSMFPASIDLRRVAAAVGYAVSVWAVVPGNVVVQGVTTGAAGGGVVNGKLFVGNGVGITVGALRQAGVVGWSADGFGQAVGSGVANAVNATAQYIGASVGVGVGADVSKVSFSNAPTLIALLVQALQAQGFVGPEVPKVSVGLGNGLAALLGSGTGIGVVTGVPTPSPAVGTSASTVL